MSDLRPCPAYKATSATWLAQSNAVSALPIASAVSRFGSLRGAAARAGFTTHLANRIGLFTDDNIMALLRKPQAA